MVAWNWRIKTLNIKKMSNISISASCQGERKRHLIKKKLFYSTKNRSNYPIRLHFEMIIYPKKLNMIISH